MRKLVGKLVGGLMGKFTRTILLYLCTLQFSSANELQKITPDETKENLPLNQLGVSSDALSKEIENRKTMLDWSRHLGVTCNYCHDTNNFKNDEKLAYKIGFKHKNLVKLLNEEIFMERDKGGNLKIVADCYMCHRGLSTPKFKEPPQNLMK
jgi:hypothetical protein